MNLKQLTLDKLRKLILRLWPGLAGYHIIRYAKITKVYQGQATDLVNSPAMAVDLQFLKHDFSKDNAFPVFKKVRLAGDSEFVQAPPSKDTYVLVHFPFWLSSTATVLSVLYLGKTVHPEENVYQIRNCVATRISAKEELVLGEGNDQAVLGTELNKKLGTLIDKISALGDQVVSLGSGGTVAGDGLKNAAAVSTAITLIKIDLKAVKDTLNDVLSNIKIGLGTDVPTT